MGTDIHLYVERRDEDDVWHLVMPPEPPAGTKKYGDYGPAEPDDGKWLMFTLVPCYVCAENDRGVDRGPSCPACAQTGRDARWFRQRSYNLFSRLAGIRGRPDNGPISEPRGVPEDLSEGLAHLHFKSAAWDHTPSWLRLDELLLLDWNSVDESFFQKFLDLLVELGPPENTRIVFGFDS